MKLYHSINGIKLISILIIILFAINHLLSQASTIYLANPSFEDLELDSGYVEVKQCKIFYKTWGKGDPIVFLNGGPGFSSEGYKTYADSFSRTNQIILFDQRGTGKSLFTNNRKSNNISMKRMVEDLDALRKHLKIETWIVYGHSFGGKYAMYYASKHPTRIKKLILSATPELSSNPKSSQSFKLAHISSLTYSELKIYKDLINELEKSKPDHELVMKLKIALKARYYVQNPKNYEKVGQWFFKNKKVEYIRIDYDLPIKRTRKELKKLEKPVFIIHGINDFLNLLCPLENKKLFSEVELKIIKNSGHIMMTDQPEIYVKSIKSFIGD